MLCKGESARLAKGDLKHNGKKRERSYKVVSINLHNWRRKAQERSHQKQKKTKQQLASQGTGIKPTGQPKKDQKKPSKKKENGAQDYTAADENSRATGK